MLPDCTSRTNEPRERLIRRLLLRTHQLANGIVEALQGDIMDYRGLQPGTISDDIHSMAVATVTNLLENLLDDGPLQIDLDVIGRSAARRVHQEVSLSSLLHSYRVWSGRIWATVLEEAGSDRDLQEAALQIVSGLLEYVDIVSSHVAKVYLEEVAGVYRARDVLRADLLESLLVGRVLSDRAEAETARLNLSATSRIVVVLIRLSGVGPERLRVEFLKAIQAARDAFGSRFHLLIGVRESDVICLVRTESGVEARALKRAADAVAGLNDTWRVALGRGHLGERGIPRSFHEAREAALVADSYGNRSVATCFADILLDRILVHSEYGEDLLDTFIRPLVDYDRSHSSDLVDTLRTFVAHDFVVARTAKQMMVSPNTIAYRVRRIGRITGQDPTSSSGMLTLSLALKLLDGSPSA